MTWWLLAGAFLALPALWLIILSLFARQVRAAWREPVLRHPVLIIESDDWGPGPETHADALHRLIECLNRYRDSSGRAPVMTLGLTLSLPDSAAIAATNFSAYHARLITDPAYAGILAAIQSGIQASVFAPQLHGMAHYWPTTLIKAAASDPAVRTWILNGPGQETETLPSPLQSRWTDASVLPSRPHPAEEIETAAAEEVTLYRNVFHAQPEVVVPPTFVWNCNVETAWAKNGVRCIVTPGRRCTGRDADGQPGSGPITIHNGQSGIGDITYLVRDRYFEPDRGHRAEDALTALAEKTAQGRPCLLETHRFNFTGAGANNALQQLDKLLELALKHHPNLRFTSAAELAQQYRTNGDWLAPQIKLRLTAWVTRSQGIPKFAKLARYSGLERCLRLCLAGQQSQAKS
jgi:hypothetical protein